MKNLEHCPFGTVVCLNWAGNKFTPGHTYFVNGLNKIIDNRGKPSILSLTDYVADFRIAYRNELFGLRYVKYSGSVIEGCVQ